MRRAFVVNEFRKQESYQLCRRYCDVGHVKSMHSVRGQSRQSAAVYNGQQITQPVSGPSAVNTAVSTAAFIIRRHRKTAQSHVHHARVHPSLAAFNRCCSLPRWNSAVGIFHYFTADWLDHSRLRIRVNTDYAYYVLIPINQCRLYTQLLL